MGVDLTSMSYISGMTILDKWFCTVTAYAQKRKQTIIRITAFQQKIIAQ